jgi:hypothetical protein
MRCAYSAGSFHLESALDHIVYDGFNSFPLLRILAIVHDAGVEIAVSNVPQKTGENVQIV